MERQRRQREERKREIGENERKREEREEREREEREREREIGRKSVLNRALSKFCLKSIFSKLSQFISNHNFFFPKIVRTLSQSVKYII